MARLIRCGVPVAATLAACLTVEIALRLVDGYAVMSLQLRAKPGARVASGSPAGKWLEAHQSEPYVRTLPTAAGVDRLWYGLDPAPRAAIPVDAELDRRYWAHPGHELQADYEWNARFLSTVLCDPNRAQRLPSRELQRFSDLFVYEPLDRSPYPTYRFLRNTHYPSGLVTNGFGWRGPDVPLNKPAGRVRIAFVGASTTIGAHGDRFSYPEYIGRWLEAWGAARHPRLTFDVVNAGREGISSRSIAAIVEHELAPVRPDIAVYYEGSNEFWPNAFVAQPLVRVMRMLAGGTLTERYSAVVARIRAALDARRNGSEPMKPPLPVSWPADLSETSPSLDDTRLPVQLPEILTNLDRIRAVLEPYGGTLMPSSFVWLVYDGMVLDRHRDALLYQYLNESYWPFSYAHLRRFADFQNRVFAAYAAARQQPFNDVASVYPRDPRLFTDAIHLTAAGVKLQAWIVFQQLVPEIARRIADGRLPVADPGGRTSHPAFTGARRLLSLDELRRNCPGPAVTQARQ
jgi:hypothetical protein